VTWSARSRASLPFFICVANMQIVHAFGETGRFVPCHKNMSLLINKIIFAGSGWSRWPMPDLFCQFPEAAQESAR
jgi:hypothetical protein